MNIHVGNLSRDVTDQDLRTAFEAFGQVTTVNVIKDRVSGTPRGFAFVEMPTQAEAEAAITGLQGKALKDRVLDVSEARPRPTGRGGGSYGDRRGGGGFRDRGRPRRF